VTSIESRRTVIDSDKPVPVQIDGETHGSTPVTIEPCDEPFRLIVPPEFH